MEITTDLSNIANVGEYVKHNGRMRKVVGYAVGDDGRDYYVSMSESDCYGWVTHLTPIDEVKEKYVVVHLGCDAE